MLDVANALFGLLNFVSTWRVSLVASIGAAGALFVFFRIPRPAPTLALAIVSFAAALWIGYRWQSSFEIRRRQSSNNRWRGP